MASAQDEHASTDDSDSATRSPRDQHEQPAADKSTAVDAPTDTTSPQSWPEEQVACARPARRPLLDRIDPSTVLINCLMLLAMVVYIVEITSPPSPAVALEIRIAQPLAIFASIASIVFSVAKWHGKLYILLYAFINIIFFILLFAELDWELSMRDPGCFTEPLFSRTDALYFAVTILSSGGPGHISPVTALCRQVVTIQVSLGYILTTLLLVTAVSTLIERITARHP